MTRWSDSLRVRLLGLATVAMLPALVITIVSAADLRQASLTPVRNELVRMSNAAATEQARLTRRAERLLDEFAASGFVDERDTEICSAHARRMLEQEADFLNLGVIDSSGWMYCSAIPFTAPINLGERRYFQRALTEQQLVVGEMQIGALTGQPSVNFARPIVREGRVEGVGFVALNADWFGRFIQDEQLPPGSSMALFDPDGRLLIRYPDPAQFVNRDVRDSPLVRTILGLQDGTAETVGFDGQLRVYAFQPLPRVSPGAAGYLAVGYAPDVLFGELNRIGNRNLALTILGALAAFALAWLFGHRLIFQPVRAIVHTTGRLAVGDLSARTGLARPRGELGELVQAIDGMAAALEHHQERLRQMEKMEAVGQLAGGIAHDFNNLLTPIVGFSELLALQLEPGDQRREFVDQIRNAGEQAASLCRQLLTFSRKQPHQPVPTDLYAAVQQTEVLMRRALGEHIAVEVRELEKAGPVLVDPGQLQQVILNLAVNARDAMAGGGRLRLETSRVVLGEGDLAQHPGARPGAYAVLSVSDTGHGMDTETQARIFEPFFSTKPMGEGTGLGLAMVYGIVQQAGGTIWVYSEPGEGTTFRIYLPETERAPALAAPTETAALPVGTERVLVVEDAEAVRTLTVTVLEALGYHVVTAADGPQALQLADEATVPFDLVISDMVMPTMGGPELVAALTQRWGQLQVLFISGFAADANITQRVLRGDIPFLQKPFTPLALARKVREVLDARPTGGAEMAVPSAGRGPEV